MSDRPDVLAQYLSAVRTAIEGIAATQLDAIRAAAAHFAATILRGRLVHVFGTGHSRMAVEEVFPRYGSFPGFHPIAELSMTFHTQVVGSNGQRQAMFIERVEGLAEAILANFDLGPPDVMMVFSASGVSAAPIEMALGARRRGLPVVAVTSVAASRAATPLHSSGTRLLDHADVVLDLCTPPGDAMTEIEGLDTPVGPGSTLAAVALANQLKARTAELLVGRGGMLPVLTSAALVGQEASSALFEAAYGEYAERVSRILRRNGAS